MEEQSKNTEKQWHQFIQQESLSAEQADVFKRYAQLLREWNEKTNLTTVTSIPSIISYHFRDSLQLARAIDMSTITGLADVGAGAGFPGIPLAIKYSHLQVTLIEVSYKKIQFLDAVITALDLGDRVSVYDKDWRTFLRTTDFDIQLICARASLQPKELLRMFKPASPYKQVTLVYWASQEWEALDKERPFIQEYVPYKVGTRYRRLIVMRKPSEV